MNYNIRKLNQDEISCLDIFLYEAIYIPEGVEAPPRDIINLPELQLYVKAFGKQKGDICYVAEGEGQIIGAAWVRIMEDYGHIDKETPSFAVSLLKEYRGLGIGSKLMKETLEEIKRQGYKRASLSVQKDNYAVKMYKKLGFQIVGENEQEFIMLIDLSQR